MSHWNGWAGFRVIVTTDRGPRDRGEFSNCMSGDGTVLRKATLEAPEQIGRGARHGGVIKSALKQLIKDHHARRQDQLKQALNVVLGERHRAMR